MKKFFSVALFLGLALIAACSNETTITGPFNSKTPHGHSFAEISSVLPVLVAPSPPMI